MNKIPTPRGGWPALVIAILALILTAFGVNAVGDSSAPPDATPTVDLPLVTGVTAAITPDPGTTAATGAVSDQTIASHEDSRDEVTGAPPNAAATVAAAANATPTHPQPLGGAQSYSCPYKPVVNYSTPSSKQIQFVVHETVSAVGTMMIIWRLFNTPSFGASSHYLMEVTGKCLKIVPLSKKAWTQGPFNSASRSVELIAPSGSTRAWWLKQPIIKRGILAALIRDNLKDMGSPLRWVDPVGCTPRAGWTDHEHLECSNNHCDVTGCDAFPREIVARQVAAGVSSPGRVVVYPRVSDFGRKRRAWCDRLAIVRKNAKADEWTEKRVAVAERYKALIGPGQQKCRFS